MTLSSSRFTHFLLRFGSLWRSCSKKLRVGQLRTKSSKYWSLSIYTPPIASHKGTNKIIIGRQTWSLLPAEIDSEGSYWFVIVCVFTLRLTTSGSIWQRIYWGQKNIWSFFEHFQDWYPPFDNVVNCINVVISDTWPKTSILSNICPLPSSLLDFLAQPKISSTPKTWHWQQFVLPAGSWLTE